MKSPLGRVGRRAAAGDAAPSASSLRLYVGPGGPWTRRKKCAGAYKSSSLSSPSPTWGIGSAWTGRSGEYNSASSPLGLGGTCLGRGAGAYGSTSSSSPPPNPALGIGRCTDVRGVLTMKRSRAPAFCGSSSSFGSCWRWWLLLGGKYATDGNGGRIPTPRCCGYLATAVGDMGGKSILPVGRRNGPAAAVGELLLEDGGIGNMDGDEGGRIVEKPLAFASGRV